MNAENLMRAIGGISDRHIEEFAIVQRKTHKALWIKVVSVTACFCVIMSAIFIIPSLLMNEQGTLNVIDPHETIWGDSSQNENVDEYINKSIKGTVIITNSLKNSMENCESDWVLYAVLITETTGKSDEYIYNSFVKPLNIREQYIDYGIIYITESQINALTCPSDMAIILSPALNPIE